MSHVKNVQSVSYDGIQEGYRSSWQDYVLVATRELIHTHRATTAPVTASPPNTVLTSVLLVLDRQLCQP